jgi:3-oxoacyl-[acyl-carrier protein] reductase
LNSIVKQKRKVLITGAGRGLGLAISKKLSEEYTLILHASKEGNIKSIGEGNYVLYADFSDPVQVSDFCKKLKKEHGDSLYGVINNAGITLDKSLIFQPEHEIDRMLNVNLKAPIMICKTAMKIFTLSKCGVIINISSCVGETGNDFQSVYAATKAGLVALSKSLAQEAAALNEEHQIRVLSVSPGYIETDMTDAIPQAEKDKYLQKIPSKRFGKAEDIAEGNLTGVHPSDLMIHHGPTKLLLDKYHWHSPKIGIVASYSPKSRDVEDHFGLFRGVDQIESCAQAIAGSCNGFLECKKEGLEPLELGEKFFPRFISIGQVIFHNYLEEGDTFINIGYIKFCNSVKLFQMAGFIKLPRE